ncbi:hypothetical protein [Luteibacter sahnii]|uniref:hypothetical protein n=1 Tax=Luteibacter sahnii TaxID=3021977 RepID=UPI002A7A65AC|nr:hypothetical protein [Luteibacter sp. PPL193]
MKTSLFSTLQLGTSAMLCLALIGCGTPMAKDFGGSWKPVNHYDDKASEIPLEVPYSYYASPMDGTLKVMLTRWSTDTNRKLSYRLRSDFTLPKAASQIHTSEARDAAAQLSAIYAPQGVAVLIDGPQIVVEEVSSVAAPVAAGAPAPSEASSPTPASK